MSNRMKRKLNATEAAAGDSGNLLESFVQYGTPLPSLEKKDKNEFVPVWEQTVTDDKGRRRLHGAFTGGFSAGYFNTVGSAEGWTPSTFVSSRKSRAQHAQKASDFMDEEDLADAKEEEMRKLAKEAAGPQQGPSSKPIESSESEDRLVNTIRQSKDRTGSALLKKMGWRDGQGVGPRLSAQARSRMARELKLPQEDWSNTAAPGQTFAPLDRPLVYFQPKENAHGLGFERGQTLRQSVNSQQQQQQQPSSSSQGHGTSIIEGGRAMPIGGAFGISALEDADEDDMSVYESQLGGSDFKAKSKLARLVQDDHEPASVSWKNPSSRADAAQRQHHTPAPTVSSASKTYLDGTPVLAGFLMAQSIPPPDAWFAPPQVPQGWQPNPKTIMSLTASIPDHGAPTGQPPPQLDHRGKPIMSADSRAAVLSDEPPKARSVFDFISKKNQERITAAKAAGQKVTEAPSAPAPPPIVELTVPHLDKAVATAALKGFMPYGDDRSKLARYKLFLQAAAGEKEAEGVFQPRAQADRVDELNKELEDFKRAAMVFKPMSSAMASRFTSGDSVQTAKETKMPHASGLSFVTAKDKQSESPQQQETDSKQTDDPVLIAVRSGMFGALTRKTTDFFPTKLLCKRFNCRQPHPDGATGGGEDDEAGPAARDESKDLLNKSTMEELRTQSGYAPPVQPVSTTGTDALKPASANQPSRSLGSIGLGNDETQGQDILTYERPSMDLFKAIFAEDSDDEDADGKAGEEPSLQTQQPVVDVTKAPSASAKANLEPVSFTDFKPTFIRRDPSSATDEPVKKKSKKEKKKATALSFDMDEDGDESAPTLKRKGTGESKKKKKAKLGPAPSSENPQHGQEGEEQEDEWVEKPTPAIPKPGRAKAADLF